MRNFQIYLCGGMGKFGKENFKESNTWRIYCKNTLENCECDYNVKAINPNDYFNFKQEVPQYKSQREIMELDLHKLRCSDMVIVIYYLNKKTKHFQRIYRCKYISLNFNNIFYLTIKILTDVFNSFK